MGIESHRIEPNWNYLLALEQDLVVLSRYVEFHERNFDCFSIEIARIILAASAEVEVVAKQLCGRVDVTSSADNIIGYRDEARMGQLAPIPQLLRVGDRHHGGEIPASHDSGLCYDLDEPRVASGAPTEEAKG